MKIGIIGIGYAGQIHLKAIKLFNSNIECYVYDVALQVAQDFAKIHNCKVANTIEELYDKTDAVIIATPTFTHYNLAMEAMKKGKHVLCEKPMALLVKEAAEMFEMSKKNNLICMIGFNYRFFEITEILKKQNKIGKMTNVKIVIKRLFRSEWHDKNNGVLADLGIHLIDYVNYLCENSIDLFTCEVNRKYINDWDYNSKVSGKMENGIHFEISASRIENPDEVQFSIEIIGEKGIFKYDSRQETTYVIEKNNNSHIYSFKKTEKAENFFDFSDSILRQDIAWIKAMTGKKSDNIATFKDGYNAQKALDYFLSKKEIK